MIIINVRFTGGKVPAFRINPDGMGDYQVTKIRNGYPSISWNSLTISQCFARIEHERLIHLSA